jgi:asparagine synthase (glutamine-hydrolysing)
MCGIAGIIGNNWKEWQIEAMVRRQRHRGPDAEGFYLAPDRLVALGHNRLSIIDLSEAGRQPMSDAAGRYWIVFNGEIYNYLELRAELASEYSFRTQTDTEVLLAAYSKWGERCLDKLIGMFAFLIWDEKDHSLFAARDRFGVKPLYFHRTSQGALFLASEIKTLHAVGVPAQVNPKAWATYLSFGFYDHSESTFWENIESLPAGCCLKWRDGRMTITQWYDLAERTPELDTRPLTTVREEYLALLKDSVRLRFRADVPVGINLSGGLDSSTLLGLVQAVQGEASDVKAFTFVTGDSNYDELPWVEQMLARTQHPSIKCEISASEVPDLAQSVQDAQDEPFGGLPTLCYARLFEAARREGVIVLLDGQGMDEQWAGYDYYVSTLTEKTAGMVQGTNESPVRPNCLSAEFRSLAEPLQHLKPFPDALRNTQYRDTRYTKIPRALRFNDRVSMRSSTELREPFLDHRLFELAFKQPPERKISNGTQKWFLRDIASELLPHGVVEAPKRPLQTPQREWLRGPLREWATDLIEMSLHNYGDAWLCADSVQAEWRKFLRGESDNSFYVWQWLSLGLSCTTKTDPVAPPVSAAHDQALVAIAE